ncbi:MAG: glycosyltransferase family 2 protein [Patescibacteria group bacterium]
MEERTKISFIIVNYNSKKFLGNCISSIRRNTISFPYEIIIVNNDSTALDFPETKIINLNNNLGFGTGCNAGAKIAQGEILCFLNPDTEILDNIKKILEYFNINNKLGIIGPKLITQENKTQHWCAGYEPSLLDLIKNNLGLYGSKKIWESERAIEADWISGACLFIKKDIFQKIGGFDKKFFMYYEDVDLCKRVREKGYKVIYFPEFKVKHLSGRSFNSKIKQKKYLYISLIYYFKKHL